MGQLVDGVWHDVWYDTKASGGRFVRSTAKFRNWITPDGSPVQAAKAASRPKPAGIIFMCPMPAPGRIGR